MITVNVLCKCCGGLFLRIVETPADASRRDAVCDGCKPKVAAGFRPMWPFPFPGERP